MKLNHKYVAAIDALFTGKRKTSLTASCDFRWIFLTAREGAIIQTFQSDGHCIAGGWPEAAVSQFEGGRGGPTAGGSTAAFDVEDAVQDSSVSFDNPVGELNSFEEETVGGSTGGGSFERESGGGGLEIMQQELRKFASEFSPDRIMATTNSLVGLLLRQRDHVGTISAFQSLIEKTYPSPGELEALHAIAALQHVEPPVIDAVCWLWCAARFCCVLHV